MLCPTFYVQVVPTDDITRAAMAQCLSSCTSRIKMALQPGATESAGVLHALWIFLKAALFRQQQIKILVRA
jgi:hypothetical protein